MDILYNKYSTTGKKMKNKNKKNQEVREDRLKV